MVCTIYKEIKCSGWAGGMIALFLFIPSCRKQDVVEPESPPYALSVPAHFPAVPVHLDNPMTREGVALGRKLFYDPVLSGNNKISCATCHLPEKAFSDGVPLGNAGMAGTTLLRHSPALINLAWANNGLFWDGGSTNLESQAFAPLTAHDEMGQNLLEMITELKAVPDYVRDFRSAFGDTIASAYVARALAQFQRTLISANARYDRVIEGKESFTIAENNGAVFFEANCSHCHTPPLFTDNAFHNNGIDNDFSENTHEEIHKGRFRITREEDDLGKFRTPTLRNLVFTAPYMHDGRFASLEEVLNHYHAGVKDGVTTDRSLYKNENENQPGLPMSETEKKNLLAFLKTLSDSSFIQNKNYSNPFK